MKTLTRLLLAVAAIAGVYSLAIVLVLGWPATGWIALILGLSFVGKRGAVHLTTLASARWAGEDDLKRAGMLDAKSGLILGKIKRRRGRDSLIRLANSVHVSAYGPTGAGKGASLIIPYLLTCAESCVVVDFKGELAKVTAEHRRKRFGHKIVILDPYKVVTQKPDTFNPIDFICKDDRLALDDGNDLAKALVVRTGKETDPHWDDSAEAKLSALIATVAYYGDKEKGTRSIQTVREIANNPEKDQAAIELMVKSDAWDGQLASKGGHLMHFVEREKASINSSTAKRLAFLGTPTIADSTKTTSFDPSELRKGKMTIYLVVPPDRIKANIGLLRMWISSLIRAVVRGGLTSKHKVHFIIDEAAQLGKMECISEALTIGRGYGIFLQIYYQTFAQAKENFPDGQEQVLLSNTTTVFFATNDIESAEIISKKLGESTIIVDSGSTNTGTSQGASFGRDRSTNRGSSQGETANWGQQKRHLLDPAEVMALPQRTAISFVPGMPPIKSTLLRYYEERVYSGWFRQLCGDVSQLVKAAIVCAIALLVAFGFFKLTTGTQARPPVPTNVPNIFGS